MQPNIDGYLLPVRYALVTFPVLAFFFTMPFLIVQYRKYGYMNKIRLVALYSLLLYLLVALYLVILPLPASRSLCAGSWKTFVSVVPLQFVKDIARETKVEAGHPLTYWRLLKERAFLEAAFNLALFVPFGLFLRYYFRRKVMVALLLSFALSLFFEITQLTGLYGIYRCPYRLFDVDDLLLNTAGGALGYWLAPMLTRYLPDTSRLDEDVDLSVKQVGYIRRWIALQLDSFVLYPFVIALLHERKPALLLGILFLYFIVLPYASNGRTFGKWAVRIQLRGSAARIRFGELLVRYGLLYVGIGGINLFALAGGFAHAGPLPTLAAIGAALGVDLVFAISVLVSLVRKDRRLFYEKWSGTRHAIVLTRGQAGPTNSDGASPRQ